jgi:hypothetical protein
VAGAGGLSFHKHIFCRSNNYHPCIIEILLVIAYNATIDFVFCPSIFLCGSLSHYFEAGACFRVSMTSFLHNFLDAGLEFFFSVVL